MHTKIDAALLLSDGLGCRNFGKEDVEKRRINALQSLNEAKNIGLDKSVIEWTGYILALDWVIACMDA